MGREFGLTHPFERGAAKRLRFAGSQAAEEEPQMDGEVLVIVREALEQFAHAHVHAQFLAQFAREALLEGFAGVPFAAGEFPQPPQMICGAALCDQQLAFAKD